MASFELKSNSCDGHIRALSRAILVASRISKEALLEFKPDKMRLCARTDIFLVKFVFYRKFFTEYQCDGRHRCFINLKALSMPFKSSVLVSDRDHALRSTIGIRCTVEDEINNQIIFKISADPPATTLTYRLSINDLDPDRMSELNAINRKVEYARVEISPKQSKKERFLLSAFNNFAPDIDQVTIKASQSEVKFIGSTSPLYQNRPLATSEFTHKKDDFSVFSIKEDTKITVPLRTLKIFLNFVETNKVQTLPKYIFEGVGMPAHFVYAAQLFEAHFVSSTPFEYVPDELEDDRPLPIGNGEPNESFIADENIIPEPDDDNYEMYNQFSDNNNDEEDDFDEDGYNDNQSDSSDFLDGNLDGIIPTAAQPSQQQPAHNYQGSLFGTESIRSEMNNSGVSYDPEKVREVLNLDQDPDEIENVIINYSSDSDDDD